MVAESRGKERYNTVLASSPHSTFASHYSPNKTNKGAPKGKAPQPPAKPAVPKKINPNQQYIAEQRAAEQGGELSGPAHDARRPSVRASPAGVKNLAGSYGGSAAPVPRSAAPRPPVPKKVSVPKKLPPGPGASGGLGDVGSPVPKKLPPAPLMGTRRPSYAAQEDPAVEEERKRREEEERRRREEEERRRREEEERRRREEEERRRREEEERRRKAEEERRRKEQEEAERKRKAEEERRRKEQEEAERRRQEEEEAAAAAAAAEEGGDNEWGDLVPAIEVLVAIADYVGNDEEDGELSFNEGDYILLVKKDESGWYQGDMDGIVGWFPSNYVRETSRDEYEAYCTMYQLTPYFEPVQEEVAPPPVKPATPAKPAKPQQVQQQQQPAPQVQQQVRSPTTPTQAQKSAGPTCPQCQQGFASAKELNEAVVMNDQKLHAKCLIAYRKSQKEQKPTGAAGMGVAAGGGFVPPPFGKTPNSMNDFEIQGLLGKGRFGKVYQCKKLDTGRIYAIKALLKSHILSSEAQRILVEREKSILQKINNPFLVRCYHIFEDSEKLYFVMECASGGELFVHLSREQSFDAERVRYYAAEMFLGLEYIHGMGIVYRDLKPENILLTAEGHILMTDFGISKEGLDNKAARTATFW